MTDLTTGQPARDFRWNAPLRAAAQRFSGAMAMRREARAMRRRARQDRLAMLAMNDRLLADLGLTRTGIDFEV